MVNNGAGPGAAPESEPESDPESSRMWTTPELLRQRSVLTSISSLLISSTAAIALGVALGVLVYDVTGSKLDLGWLGLAEFGPTALLVFVSGPVADRFDRRRIIAIAFAVEAVVCVGFVLFIRGHHASIGPLYLGVIIYGTARAFGAPAVRSLIPASAPDLGSLPRVVAISSVGWQVGAILGPVIAAWAYDWSPERAFELVVALQVASVIVALAVPVAVGRAHVNDDAEVEKPSLRSALEGLRVIRAKPVLLGAMTLDLVAVLFGGAVALLPAIAKDVLHGGAREVGIMRTAGGIGAALTTVLLASRPLQRRVGHWMLASVGLFGAATVLLGSARSIVIAVIGMFILNSADSVSVFIRSALVPLVTPPEQRGRVLAVESVFIGGSNELGAFESGVAGRFLGTTPAVVSGGVAVLVIVSLFWFVFPSLRDVDRFEDVIPTS